MPPVRVRVSAVTRFVCSAVRDYKLLSSRCWMNRAGIPKTLCKTSLLTTRQSSGIVVIVHVQVTTEACRSGKTIAIENLSPTSYPSLVAVAVVPVSSRKLYITYKDAVRLKLVQ